MTPIAVHGMHGMGDNIHQRALVRQLMERHEVWLDTPWPSIYHDLVGDRLKLVSKGSSLRTQAKNAVRERDLFHAARLPMSGRAIQVHYPPQLVRQHRSVLKAMLAAVGASTRRIDFRMPIKPEWEALADAWLARWGNPTKPLMIYRPLVTRKEWSGTAARNPDHAAYQALYRAIRPEFFVVSIADLAPGAEWLALDEPDVDVRLHGGEIVFEALAALFTRAALVFTAPGFPVVLSQAVGAPHVAIFGGYERAYSFSAGADFAPHLYVEPVRGCDCFEHHHPCEKRIDLAAAMEQLREFVQ